MSTPGMSVGDGPTQAEGQSFFEAVGGHATFESIVRAFYEGVAADPVLDPPQLASALGARLVPVPAGLLRAAAGATWKARLQPTMTDWVDMALMAPLMDTTRAHRELGWQPLAHLRAALGRADAAALAGAVPAGAAHPRRIQDRQRRSLNRRRRHG